MTAKDVLPGKLRREMCGKVLRLKCLAASLVAALPLSCALAQQTPVPASGASSGAPAGVSSGAGAANPSMSLTDGFTTVELAAHNLVQLPMCLEYKIVGISLRMYFVLGIPVFFWTPHVEHYSPDMVNMSHKELDQMPWIEYNLLMGYVLKQVSNVLFAEIVARLFGLGDGEIGGGRFQYTHWGEHQGVQFSDNTVVGSPIAIFLEMFTYKPKPRDGGSGRGGGAGALTKPGQDAGGRTAQFSGSAGNGQGRPGVSQADVGAWLASWANGDTSWPPVFSDALGMQEVLTMMAESPVVEGMKALMEKIDTALAAVGGRVGNSPFCPVNPTPFEPYYLSGIDAYLWRMGYPATDFEHSTTILNPFSSDTIKPTANQDGALIEIPQELAQILTPKWGNVYPREGALDQPVGSKLGAVVARRSQSLLGESEKPLGRLYRVPKYRVKSAAWSKEWPTMTMCHRNIANTGEELEEHDRYAWTMWTAHDCDLYRRGVLIMTVPLGPIYVTPPIAE